MQRVKENKLTKIIGKNLVIALLLVMVFGFSFLTTGFATSNNFFNLLRQCSIMGVVAAGMSIVIISGGIDLSVGSSISLYTVVTSLMITSGINVFISCIAGIVMCVLIGLLNGFIIYEHEDDSFYCHIGNDAGVEGTGVHNNRGYADLWIA